MKKLITILFLIPTILFGQKVLTYKDSKFSYLSRPRTITYVDSTCCVQFDINYKPNPSHATFVMATFQINFLSGDVDAYATISVNNIEVGKYLFESSTIQDIVQNNTISFIVPTNSTFKIHAGGTTASDVDIVKIMELTLP